jgi:hypothetical protein
VNRLFIIITAVVVALTVASCKPKTPEQYIQEADMEAILADYHLAAAIAQEKHAKPVDKQLYLEEVLVKHGVTREQFDSSLVYYYVRADRLNDIYMRVVERLEEQALAMGASESDLGKFAALNESGDTANIWHGRSTMSLLPAPPYNRLDFAYEADSTFKAGDEFLMQFVADFMFQDGTKEAQLYMAAYYPDTVITAQSRIYNSGLNQVRMSGHNKPVRQIKGYIYLGDSRQQSTTLRILFISNVQFIRFHTHKYEQPNDMPADSLALPDATRGNDSIHAGDSTEARSSGVPLSVERRDGTDRVVGRNNQPKIRLEK